MISTSSKQPQRIGRFEIVRTLGTGAEGTVYLASDPHLGRQVALKTLLVGAKSGLTDDGIATLMGEARIVSTLSHPNIVPLYDAGEDGPGPYLVFEYVEGKTLAALIREEGALESARAVEISIALAQGVAYAHERNIVHRDLKPANVMITSDGTPRLMDFGIAQRVAHAGTEASFIVGTPSYMAPEYIRDRTYLPASDVFSLGVLLYEMLTGKPPVGGRNGREVVRRIVEEEFAPPSKLNPKVDEHLDALVMKALAKAPHERFAGAAEFSVALRSYLEPEEAGTGDAQGTLEYLLRRIRHKGDFPALSSTISAVNRAASSDREPIAVLCNSILRDFALTSRLLKIVNASALNQFGGAIGTVSRAVSILGYNSVRNVSMSLVLFEHMHDRSNATALKDQVVSIYFSGLLARELHGSADLRDAEQAFICAMFHRLGKLLATFYLHEEAQVVDRHVQTKDWDEQRASREVLGISYEELGVGVGKAWNFPEEILESMRPVAGPVNKSPPQENERLRLLANLANELADVVQGADDSKRALRLKELVARYGKATGITERALTTAVQNSANAMMRDADSLGHGVARNGFLKEAKRWGVAPQSARGRPKAEDEKVGVEAPAGEDETLDDAAEGEASASARVLAHTQRLVADDHLTQELGSNLAQQPGRRQAALAAGVQEITNTLVGDHSLNDVLRVILETMYRSIGFDRTLLFVLDARQQVLRCRFGFGADVERIVRKGTAAPLGGARDIFYAAVVLGADLCIEDMNSEKVRAHVPQWYRDAIGARGMVLLPIVNRKKTLGLIYADSSNPATLHFSAEELGLLKTLRNQAVLAMRQGG